MATTIDYIDELLKEKGVSLKERCDITDKLISFEVFDEPIDVPNKKVIIYNK